MVAKKKNNTVKKAVKKTVKKVVKPKKVIKTVAAKNVKKAVKKPVAKSAKKTIKKVKLLKKVSSTVKASKKVVAKKTSVKKLIQKPVKVAHKTVIAPKMVSLKKMMSEKTTTISPVRQSVVPRQTEQLITKKPIMREVSKMASTAGRNVIEEIDFIENVDIAPSKKATTLLGALEFTPYQIKPDEAYMNEHQRDHFRKILSAWKQQLMQDVDTTVGHLKEDAVFYADPVDRASQEEGFNLELRTRDRERRLIKKIEQSHDLLNNGEYGFCEDCGAEIGIRRLEARPTAVKCIDCKTFQEIREKQMGG